jgi:hypothetical protein
MSTISGVEFRPSKIRINGIVLRVTYCFAEGVVIARILESQPGGDWIICKVDGNLPIARCRTERVGREMVAEMYADVRGDLWQLVKRVADRGACETLALKHGKDGQL